VPGSDYDEEVSERKNTLVGRSDCGEMYADYKTATACVWTHFTSAERNVDNRDDHNYCRAALPFLLTSASYRQPYMTTHSSFPP
jgi:hypothetical protein